MKALRILTIVGMWLAMAGHVLADELNIPDISIKPGETTDVTVALSNPDRAYAVLEFTLTLPEGVDIPKTGDDYAVMLNSSRCPDSFTLDVQETADGTYKFLIFSGTLDNITGSSGALFTMTLTAAADAPNGKFSCSCNNQVFATADGEGFEPADKTFSVKVGGMAGDVNSDGKVTIADVTALVNIILGKDDGPTPMYDHDAANVNGDDKVTIADVTALVNIILGKN